MFKKFILVCFIVLVAVVGYFAYQWYFKNDNFLKQINLVPKNAVYLIQTNEPVKNWKKFSESKVWTHFKQHPKFKEIANNANVIDKFFEDNKTLLGNVGSHYFTLSAHVTKYNDYDFLFLLDLGKASKISLLKENVENVFSKLGYRVTIRKYKEEIIYELLDLASHQSLYLSIVSNQAVCSYYGLLVEQAIDEKDIATIAKKDKFIEIEEKTSEGGLARLFINYNYANDMMRCYLSNNTGWASEIGSTLEFSGISMGIEDDALDFSGYTNLKDSTDGYLKALLQSGKGNLGAYEILSARTATYTSIGCSNFQVFYDNLLHVFSANKTAYNEFEVNVAKIEKLLKINLKSNFYSWMGDEVVLSQNQSSSIASQPEYLLTIHANNIEEASKNLNFVEDQIRKRTPAKFQKQIYKEHEIHYLEVKGLFSTMLGKYFNKIEKPYYTIINDYVCFSNTPASIISLIDDYENKNTLGLNEEFKLFLKKSNNEATLFIYVNGNRYFNKMVGELKGASRSNAIENKKYIVCFRHSAFELIANDKNFVTKFVSDFGVPSEEDLNTDLDEQKMLYEKDTLTDMERFYVERFLSGTIKEDHENGKPKIRAETKDGLKNGKYREYYEDGSLKVKGTYSKGKKDGKWSFYDEEGKLVTREKYRKGELLE